jgi:hypothetical protein
MDWSPDPLRQRLRNKLPLRSRIPPQPSLNESMLVVNDVSVSMDTGILTRLTLVALMNEVPSTKGTKAHCIVMVFTGKCCARSCTQTRHDRDNDWAAGITPAPAQGAFELDRHRLGTFPASGPTSRHRRVRINTTHHELMAFYTTKRRQRDAPPHSRHQRLRSRDSGIHTRRYRQSNGKTKSETRNAMRTDAMTSTETPRCRK